MIRSILHLDVQSGREDEFERAFATLDVLGRAAVAAHLRTGELLRSLDGGGYVVVATWDGPDDYRAWQDSPARAEMVNALEHFVEPGRGGDLYEIVVAFRREA